MYRGDIMLNEERVKHMVKLSFYETKGGSEEIKISSHLKKTYLRLNALWSFLWVTVAYVVFVTLVGVAFMPGILENLGKPQKFVIGFALSGIYLVVLIAYLVKTRTVYKKKHARAYHHVQRFKEDLAQLERMYQKEDDNGKTI